MPGRFALKQALIKIWHAPDNIHIMDPLPLPHRRGIIAGILLVVVGFLLPSSENGREAPSANRDAQLDLSSSQSPQSNQQQPLPPVASTPPVNDPDQVAPSAPEVIQEEDTGEQGQLPQNQTETQSQALQTAPGIEQQWRSYRIEPGKTLAQLFRDHDLPVTDAYAMSKVEGAGKPLSSLQAGQIVKIRQNANGVVTGMTIDTGDNQQMLFTRQSDNSFIRAR